MCSASGWEAWREGETGGTTNPCCRPAGGGREGEYFVEPGSYRMLPVLLESRADFEGGCEGEGGRPSA